MTKDYRTVLIGNGLGMAINPEQFSIETGLIAAWNKLNDDTQIRIRSLITNGNELVSEQQLDNHYEAIQACLSLRRFENPSQLKWLQDNARDFPDRFNEFVKNTGWHFFEQPSNNEGLLKFIDNLRTFILENNNVTHLVTLNYDKLIYDHFCTDKQIMNGFSGKLVDGFLVDSTGFLPSNLTSFYENFGWYLHLHGSPLFYTNVKAGIIDKSKFRNIYFEDDPNFVREHLILCNTKLKPTQISQSPLLYWYWNYFRIALKQSKTIYLIGYSGKDDHINEELSRIGNDKKIIIVEYADLHNLDARGAYWSSKLNLNSNYFSNENLILLPSILTYRFSNDEEN